jgi:hypothetical protein
MSEVHSSLRNLFIMKYILFVLLIGSSFLAKAQTGCDPINPADSAKYAQVWNWSMDELQEAAKTTYFNLLDSMNKKTPCVKGGFEKALNQYEYWRKVIGLKLTNKKDRDDFYNQVVSEAKAAGKLNG